jgi:SOS-response transcriptional repressor LexA
MSKDNPQGIPERRELVLQAIKDYRKNHRGIPPTHRELCELTGITSSSVLNYYLQKLEEAGAIFRYHGIARGIVVIEK